MKVEREGLTGSDLAERGGAPVVDWSALCSHRDPVKLTDNNNVRRIKM